MLNQKGKVSKKRETIDYGDKYIDRKLSIRKKKERNWICSKHKIRKRIGKAKRDNFEKRINYKLKLSISYLERKNENVRWRNKKKQRASNFYAFI